MKKNFLSTPIYYANDKPHIGHLYTNLLLDVWVRVGELFEKDFVASTGIDEHGQKVYNRALEKGYLAQDYTNVISDEFTQFFTKYHCNWTNWVRTSDEMHKKAVHHFWGKLVENGYIYKGKYEGWYNISDENYVPGDFDNEEFKKNKNTVWKSEECYYFKLSAFQEPLQKFFKENPEFIYPKKRYNEAVAFLERGLKDFVISRPKERQFWGISVPNDDDQIVYVWIDALVNYLSTIGYPDEKYKDSWPGFHLLGKDILKFHAIYWPALLMGAGVELPKKLIVHGWWLKDEEKISKSKGNAVDLDEVTTLYRVDGVRYFMLKAMSLGEDATFNEEAMQKVLYNELANRLGNVFLRMIGLVEARLGNSLNGNSPKNFSDIEITQSVKQLKDIAHNFFQDPSKFNEYKDKIYECIMLINGFIEKKKIWEMTDLKECTDILCYLIDQFKRIMILAWPFIPTISSEVLAYLRVKPRLSELNTIIPYEFTKFKPIIMPKIAKNK